MSVVLVPVDVGNTEILWHEYIEYDNKQSAASYLSLKLRDLNYYIKNKIPIHGMLVFTYNQFMNVTEEDDRQIKNKIEEYLNGQS